MSKEPKTCVNCKYEPKWSGWFEQGDYFERRYGTCNYPITKYIPWAVILEKTMLVQYRRPNSAASNDCEKPQHCPCWEPKSKPRKFVPDDYSLAT